MVFTELFGEDDSNTWSPCISSVGMTSLHIDVSNTGDMGTLLSPTVYLESGRKVGCRDLSRSDCPRV